MCTNVADLLVNVMVTDAGIGALHEVQRELAELQERNALQQCNHDALQHSHEALQQSYAELQEGSHELGKRIRTLEALNEELTDGITRSLSPPAQGAFVIAVTCVFVFGAFSVKLAPNIPSPTL
jgi:FtsZ-binding cell division protein ZapB